MEGVVTVERTQCSQLVSNLQHVIFNLQHIMFTDGDLFVKSIKRSHL